jgi:DNA mismatch endonuclease (patch repair protein)
MDILSPHQRHMNMVAIKGKDTKPEIIVRKYLWHRGFRYLLNDRRLPGRPDIVLKKYRTCIFVNGCFWHGHEGCRYYVVPKSNTEFWKKKIARNIERDREEQQQLAKLGWHCITVWECELKKDRRESTLESLAFTLNHIYLQDHSIPYLNPEEESIIAAEQGIDE